MTTTKSAHTARWTKGTFSTYAAAMAGTVALVAACMTLGAPAASADTAPTCPAPTTVGNVTTTWDLVGDFCVSTITTTASPTAAAADATYTCPAGCVPDKWSPPSTGVYPGDNTCVQFPAPVPTDQWACPAGFTAVGWTSPSTTRPPNHSCVTYKTVDVVDTQPATVTSYACGSNKTIGSDIGLDPAVCWSGLTVTTSRGRGRRPACSRTNGWSCPAGWTGPNHDHECTQVTGTMQVIDHRTDADASKVCAVPDSVGPACVNPPPTCTPTRTNPVKADHYFCARGFTPTGEVAADATCTKVDEGTSQPATCSVLGDVLTDGQCVTPVVPVVPVVPATVVPGGPTPTIDYCPDLDGVQWEGYDCAVPAAPVTAVEAATVVIPEAGTVPEETPVVAPQPGTVPEKAPATVPQAATVPTAVNAGGGSSSDGAPSLWLVALALLASATCLGATVRLASGRTR
jgi:hypothetical protein